MLFIRPASRRVLPFSVPPFLLFNLVAEIFTDERKCFGVKNTWTHSLSPYRSPMRAASMNSLISPCFPRGERNWLSIFICIILVALAVPLGDFAGLRTDSPPTRAAALTVPGGDSWTGCDLQIINHATALSHDNDGSLHTVTPAGRETVTRLPDGAGRTDRKSVV